MRIAVVGAGVSVYIGLRIAMSESQKDIEYMRESVKALDERITKHADSESHPSRQELLALKDHIAEIKKTVTAQHNRLEDKLDDLLKHVINNK